MPLPRCSRGLKGYSGCCNKYTTHNKHGIKISKHFVVFVKLTLTLILIEITIITQNTNNSDNKYNFTVFLAAAAQ